MKRKPRPDDRPKDVCKRCWWGVAVDDCPACKRLRTIYGGRRNPALTVLYNPGPPPAPKAWEKFHLRGRDHARMAWIPDISGVPSLVTSLGKCEGLEVVDRWGDTVEVRMRPTSANGPFLVTDEAMQRLWIVAPKAITSLLRHDGQRSAAIYYFPPENSAKYDKDRGYRHEWGDGSRTPKGDWPAKHYPRLKKVDRGGRAYEFVGGRFRVEPRGIVG